MDENQENKEEVKVEKTEPVKTECSNQDKQIKGLVAAVIVTMAFLTIVAIVIVVALMGRSGESEGGETSESQVDEECTEDETESLNVLLYDSPDIRKPILYFYPEEETEVNVKLGYSQNITCSYPKYKEDGWNVLAKPNGDLIDLDTGKNLYALYYESENEEKLEIEKEGFIVRSEDVAHFLEEKLRILGLTDREAEEFIVYWLPTLEANAYNYIRFASSEEINQNMPLELSVEPDTLIRVQMVYQGIDKPIEVVEQAIEPPERTGFVVVEWGGTEIK